MSSIGLAVPVALPAVAALVTWALDQVGLRLGGLLCAAAAWLAVGVLLLTWLPGRTIVEVSSGFLAPGIQLGLRLDAVSFAFELLLLVPAALLLTFQSRLAHQGALSGFAVSAASAAVAASGLVLAALAWGTAVTLLVLLLQDEDEAATRPHWTALILGWLCLLWAGAILVAGAGTAVYAAIPISALSIPVFILIAIPALLTSGLTPWRGWMSAVWDRSSTRAAGLAVATLLPLGFYLLTRAYAIGAGRYPSLWLNLALAGLGAAVALSAAARAQSARDRHAYLSEVIPGLAGLALLAEALGTPVGVTAAILTLAAASLLAAVLPLLPARGSGTVVFAMAVAAGAPPSLAFAARLLDIQAALEAGEITAFLALAGAIAWLWSLAGAARAMRLPRSRESAGGSPHAAVALSAFVLAAGAAAGVFATTLAMPAAAGVMTFPRSALTGGNLALVTASGAWPAVALAGPLLAVAAIAVVAVRGGPLAQMAEQEPPPPYFPISGAAVPGRLWAGMSGLRLPPDYRSLFDPAAMEAAMRRGQPWFWVATTAVLALLLVR